MISVNNLTISFGGEPLFEEISFLINPKDRVGLAGKNGAGKSTLLKILAGLQSYDSGEVAKPNNCTIGYLPQDMSHNLGKTVFDEAASSFVEVKAIEKKIADINYQLETRTDYESEGYMKLLHDLHDLGERMNLLGGYSLDADIETTLLGLGFERSDFTRLMDEFSGGWRMRVELAKLLLQKPNVLLLDEPTNHLDIESIQWLEDFLKNYYGAVVMVSHDRAFLDSITTRTIEITMGRIYDYRANYSKYLVMRKERREQQEAAKKNQDRYIEKTQVLIDKFRAKKDKAAFAQSLIKKLEKLEIVEVDDEDTARIHFRFPPAPRSGKIVVEARQVKKQYGDKVIFSDVDFMIEREDKVAFVGRNGEGKSTMIKLISGVEKGEGNLTIGANVSIGYFAQNQAETLDGSKTVFDTIDEVAVGEVRKAVRTLLGSFLFSGDDADKKVKVLSGGEKNRLAMCKLLLQPYSLLVLDEPTNHLDMRSKEVLKSALMNYDGTLIIVSHDRDFLSGMTNKTFEFRDKKVKQHLGDVNEYIASRKIASLSQLNAKAEKKREEPAEEKKSGNGEKKEKEKEIRHIQGLISKSEKEIAKLEAEIKAIDDKLMNPQQYAEVVNDKTLYSRYEDMKKSLEAEMSNWETLQQKLDAVKA
ncbi:MAG: ABC-F family ATP-binding cassette domain-containing protein [Bacteroidota bacterium]